jgi:hypothetical protein
MPLPTRPSTGASGAPGGSRRLAAAARNAQQQPHAQLLDLQFVENLNFDTRVPRDGRRPLRELAGGQRVTRLVRELASEVARFTENPSAGDRISGPLHDVAATFDDDCPGRRRRRRLIAVQRRLVGAAVELRERQPFGRGLCQLRDVAPPTNDERHAADPFLPGRKTSGSCELSDELAATVLASPRSDERHPPGAPLAIGERCHENIEWLALKLAARQRARDFATGRGIESRYGGAGIVEPRDDQKVRRCR